MPWPSPSRGDVVGAAFRRHHVQPGVAEVAGADQLAVAGAGGELLAGLARPGEGAAVRLPHDDVVTLAVGTVGILGGGRRGAERSGCEGAALRPDAGVDVADHDASAGGLAAAEGLPQSVASRQAEEVLGVLVVGDLVEGVRRDRQHPWALGERGRLRGGQVGGEAVGDHRVVALDVRAHRRGGRAVFAGEVRAVAHRVRAGQVDLAAGRRGGAGYAVDPAPVGGCRPVGEGDDVPARGPVLHRHRSGTGRRSRVGGNDGRQGQGEREAATRAAGLTRDFGAKIGPPEGERPESRARTGVEGAGGGHVQALRGGTVQK